MCFFVCTLPLFGQQDGTPSTKISDDFGTLFIGSEHHRTKATELEVLHISGEIREKHIQEIISSTGNLKRLKRLTYSDLKTVYMDTIITFDPLTFDEIITPVVSGVRLSPYWLLPALGHIQTLEELELDFSDDWSGFTDFFAFLFFEQGWKSQFCERQEEKTDSRWKNWCAKDYLSYFFRSCDELAVVVAGDTSGGDRRQKAYWQILRGLPHWNDLRNDEELDVDEILYLLLSPQGKSVIDALYDPKKPKIDNRIANFYATDRVFREELWREVRALGGRSREEWLVTQLPRLKNLRSLKLSHCSHASMGNILKALAILPQLEHIHLDHCRVDYLPDELTGMPKLKTLRITNNEIKPKHSDEIADRLPNVLHCPHCSERLPQTPERDTCIFFSNKVLHSPSFPVHLKKTPYDSVLVYSAGHSIHLLEDGNFKSDTGWIQVNETFKLAFSGGEYDYSNNEMTLQSVLYLDLGLKSILVSSGKGATPEALFVINAAFQKIGYELPYISFLPSLEVLDSSLRIYYPSVPCDTGKAFYVRLQPFILDSLWRADFSDVRLKGTLYSDGVLPELPVELYLMPDSRLGFEMQSPSAGISLYPKADPKKNGTVFHGTLSLDGNGLRGRGKLYGANWQIEGSEFIFDRNQTRIQLTTWKDKKNGPLNKIVPKPGDWLIWKPYEKRFQNP